MPRRKKFQGLASIFCMSEQGGGHGRGRRWEELGVMVAPGIRFPPPVCFRKLSSKCWTASGSRWFCGSWSLFSGLTLEAGLLGVVNVRGRRAPTDRSSSRREQLVRLAALGMGDPEGVRWPEAAGPGMEGGGSCDGRSKDRRPCSHPCLGWTRFEEGVEVCADDVCRSTVNACRLPNTRRYLGSKALCTPRAIQFLPWLLARLGTEEFNLI